MKILFIYRNPKMGFSIGKVFKPVEKEMLKYAEVDSIELPCSNYSPKSLYTNIKFARMAAAKKDYDIVHITGAEYYLLPFLHRWHTVVTVHDLGFFTNQKMTLRSFGKYLIWIRTLKTADFVTFISAKSEKEGLRMVKLRPGKHGVVLNPLGAEFQPVQKEINTKCPVILHVGTKPNKNLESTAIALKGFPCKLRIIGKLTDGQKAVLKLFHIPYECVCNLTDEEILQEYIQCDFVNFPSLYEGFGMPIIEGQAIGRPVLTSNLSPMKEVAGEGAILINPAKPEDIRRGYVQMMVEASSLVEKGYENVKRFALPEITRQYWDIYRLILEEK